MEIKGLRTVDLLAAVPAIMSAFKGGVEGGGTCFRTCASSSVFVFESGSHGSQPDLRPTLYPRLAMNS